MLDHDQQKIQILAKIDTVDAVNNFQNIIKSADGVIILRNELGMELSPEKLCLAQKWLL